jgi:NDP-sugar pyrophosphorylase family protein
MLDLFVKHFFDETYYLSDSILRKFPFPWEVIKSLEEEISHLQLGVIKSKIPEGVFLNKKEQIFIDEDCIIEPGAYIEGPCYIEKRCIIRHGAYIRGQVVLRQGAIVGHCSEVKNSFFFPLAKAPHFNYVGDSILGSHVNLGAGVKIANYRLDKQKIFIPINGKRVETDTSKLGAIIGDRVSLGCNSVTNPGTLIEKDFSCSPCSNLKGYVSLRSDYVNLTTI